MGRKVSLLHLTLAIILVSTACQTMQKPVSPGQLIELGLSSFNAEPALLLRTQDGGVAVIPTDARYAYQWIGDSPEEIAYVTLDGTWRELRLERKFECDYAVYYSGFDRLADGRLALRGYCTRIGPQQAASYLLAYDEAQQTTSLLVPSPLPIDDSLLFTWDPSVTRALVSFGSLFSGLYWLDATGAQPVTGTIQANGKSFSLETAFVGFNRDGVSETGNATAPAWSPDGSTVAFFASIDSINRKGLTRITGSWLLCLMDAQMLRPTVVLKDIYQIGKLRWSSNGRFIAFNGQVGSKGVEGLWVYSVSKNEIILVAEGTFSDFIWSIDAQALYGIRHMGEEADKKELWQFDVGRALSTPNNSVP